MRNDLRTYVPLTLCLVGAVVAAPPVLFAAAVADEHEHVRSALVSHVVGMADMSRGVCSVVGCEDGKVVLELVRQTDFLVHVWGPRGSGVAAARKLLDREALHVKRAVVEEGAFNQLPYADNTVDLVVAVHLTDRELGELPPLEVLRVLRPRGKAVLGRSSRLHGADGLLTRPRLQQWLGGANVNETAVREDDAGIWAQLRKPPLEGVDDWSHWEHGPDNNPVSSDTVIRAPYMTQWLGLPYYIAMPAITTASGGRIFIAMGHIAHHEREEPWLNTLMARNGYNGAILWTRKLPDGYLAHRSAFIATPEVFYMIEGNGRGCLLLDPETGEQNGRIHLPEVHGDWKWIALKDGVLFALLGRQKDPPQTTIVRSQRSHWSWGELSRGYYQPRVPWGFGTTILAYDIDEEKVLWTHKEDKPLDSRALTIGGGALFFYGPESHIGCLDIKSGKPRWTNDDSRLRELIEEPGRGLRSTAGFRTACYALYTPKALFFEAQTRMNIVAASVEDGHLMWHRKKTTNNPNMLYLDGRLLVGIGPDGSTLVLDPTTGNTIEDLGFKKRSCARLTATPDSIFCRGQPEGLTRYDRVNKRILFNGAFRPACNDGVIAANGLLYAGPWLCDCNLSLMGRVALCSAGKFEFEREATEAERLEVGQGDILRVAALDTSDGDWTTYRADLSRSAGSEAAVSRRTIRIWKYRAGSAYQPTAPTAAGSLVFLGGNDGKVRAIDGVSGALKWSFLTAGPIMRPPTIWNGRAYVGSGDGYIYALEAATGRLLWRFRAAPVERRIMVYGALCSTWPVNAGVLVKDGVAYAAAGIIDYDGTYVYALDAVTGKIKWQNTTSGHLDKQLRKGVSAQGVITIADGRLWMAGGNVVSPAVYDLQTGEYVGGGPGNGSPKASRGEEIGVLKRRYLILGGRLQYSARENVVNPGSFAAMLIKPGQSTGRQIHLHGGKIPPAWRDDRIVLAAGRNSVPTCCAVETLERRLAGDDRNGKVEHVWRADWLEGSDTVALAIGKDTVVAVCESRRHRRLTSRWRVCCMSLEDGRSLWEHELPSPALPSGLLIDRDGRVIVAMDNGNVLCYGGDKPMRDYLAAFVSNASDPDVGRQEAVEMLVAALQREHDAATRQLLIGQLEELGYRIGPEAKKKGWIMDWQLLGPVPWDARNNPTDKVFVDEPNVDTSRAYTIGKRDLRWQGYAVDDPSARVDLERVFGRRDNVAAYAYAEMRAPNDQDVLIKIGSDDGFKCWFNGKEVGRFDGLRSYEPDQDVLRAQAKQGMNKILLKITQAGGGWAFSARLTDSRDEPIDLNPR